MREHCRRGQFCSVDLRSAIARLGQRGGFACARKGWQIRGRYGFAHEGSDDKWAIEVDSLELAELLDVQVDGFSQTIEA